MLKLNMKNDKYRYMAETFAISMLGGYLFYILCTPIPWTLGPMISVVLWKKMADRPVMWPINLRNAGLMVVGYGMGSTVTMESGWIIVSQLPAMFLVTSLSILVSLGTAYVTHKSTGISLVNTLMGSMPGGVQQMAVYCDEVAGADVTTVTFMQTIRLLATVFVIPLLAMQGLTDMVLTRGERTALSGGYMGWGDGEVFLLAVPLIVLLARRLRIPSPYLFGSVIATGFLTVNGYQPPRLWPPLGMLAQLCVGIAIGIRIRTMAISNWQKLTGVSLLGVMVLIVTSYGLAKLVSSIQPVSLITAFLSTSPGGLTEMSITAMTMHENVAVVLSYQLFRLMFIISVAAPLLRWWLLRKGRAQMEDV